MTMYYTGNEVEIVGADISGDNGWTVWWTYANPDEVDDIHYGIYEDPISQLVADGGLEEVMEAIEQLPETRVREAQALKPSL